MVTNRDFRRFLSWSAACVVIGALLAMALVMIVDPYRIYQLIDVPGFNHIKPLPGRYQKEIKLIGARTVGANIFILGNSRAEIGLNPNHATLSNGAASTYNLALSGTTILTAQQELEHLQNSGQQPSKIILGIDFLDFLMDPATPPPLPGPAKAKHNQGDLKWQFDALFSMTSIADAIKTLQIQHAADAETMTARGFNPLLEYNKYARDAGYYPLFQQRAIEYAKTFITKPRGLVHSNTGSSQNFDGFRAILLNAASHQTELHVLIYPYHAQMLAMFEQVSLWPAFEQWKEMLVQEIAIIKKAHPNANITLWDFSGFSAFQCEQIPAKGDRAGVTQWYWESGHFKPALGDIVLSRILRNSQNSAKTDNIGFPVTSSNLVENQLRIDRERTACITSYPALFTDAAVLIGNARGKPQ